MSVSRCIGQCAACDGDWIIERIMRRRHNEGLVAFLERGAFHLPHYTESRLGILTMQAYSRGV